MQSMFLIKLEPQFMADYARFKRRRPELIGELRDAIDQLAATGSVSEGYRPHALSQPGGNYNEYIDFHLSEGAADVIVLYMPHRTNPVIRLVRIGEHSELFQGPLR